MTIVSLSTAAASLGRPEAQIGLVHRLAASRCLCCSDQMIRVNSRSGSSLLRWQHHKHCHSYYHYYCYYYQYQHHNHL